MVKFFCAVDGAVFEADIDQGASVSALKGKIHEKRMFQFPADDLQLFLAKTEGGAWLTKADVKNGVKDTTGLKLLDAGRAKLRHVGLSDEDVGEVAEEEEEEEEEEGKGPVHVLVVVPEHYAPHVPTVSVRTRAREGTKQVESAVKRHKGIVSKWEWKQEEEPIYCLEDNRMFFVNRETATEQLLKTHEQNYTRAMNKGGMTWEIPLVDNVSGLGKSTFGQEYIRRCNQKWDTLSDKREGKFLDVIRKSHTINIQLFPMDILAEEGNFDAAKAGLSLINHVRFYFEVLCENMPRALNPTALTNRPFTLSLSDLTAEVGPLFIVFDDIGASFDHAKLTDDIKRGERFMTFCDQVLHPLLSIEKIFFLIAGRASFLNYVGFRLTNRNMVSTPFVFPRLSLYLLRPPAIEEIIRKTYLDGREKVTIMEHCSLEDKHVTEVAVSLFKKTFGHPRSLVGAFKMCHTYDDFINYVAPDAPDAKIDWKVFAEELRHYEKPLRCLMDCLVYTEDNSVDLSGTWRGEGGKISTLDAIANRFGIAWEGTVTQAKLYMPSHVQRVIFASVYPPKELLEKVTPAIGEISIDYADQFELICLTRFQELFHEERYPKDVLPSFFPDKQLFGQCLVQFAKSTCWMPNIARSGNTHPGGFDKVMTCIDDVLIQLGRLSLKPLPQSASPDILLITMLPDGRKLMVGVAVKSYTGSSVTKKTVEEECNKFNRMLGSSMVSLNVLIVCATAFAKEFNVMFTNRDGTTAKSALYPSGDAAYVNEIILLNLSTSESRAEFFGIQENVVLQETLESVLKQTRVDTVLPVAEIIEGE
ncbi:unnamed protein product [Phytophthora fragariaefolia]|uniref:Unnamed protein product n=1 Tax=Phytophthora fragariaefolia TaxID=1490495 RepID=A0A9W7CV91_9STRA|nr:unnamed protein product [Phytophthora fragariaefolia]